MALTPLRFIIMQLPPFASLYVHTQLGRLGEHFVALTLAVGHLMLSVDALYRMMMRMMTTMRMRMKTMRYVPYARGAAMHRESSVS